MCPNRLEEPKFDAEVGSACDRGRAKIPEAFLPPELMTYVALRQATYGAAAGGVRKRFQLTMLEVPHCILSCARKWSPGSYLSWMPKPWPANTSALNASLTGNRGDSY